MVSAAAALAISQMMRGPVEGQTPDDHGAADGGRQAEPERHLAGRRVRPTGICRIIRRERGPVLELGAVLAVPAGLSVVEGNEIPYQPWAAAKKKENYENWLTRDPEVKCYLPGRAARDLHAVSVSDRADRQQRS